MDNYSQINTISSSEFDKKRPRLEVDPTAIKSEAADIRAIEKFLELREGVLANQTFYVSNHVCQCGRKYTFFDLVHSSVVDAHHSKSFVAHTLIGSKYILNPPRKIKCSSCGAVPDEGSFYETPRYGCSGTRG